MTSMSPLPRRARVREVQRLSRLERVGNQSGEVRLRRTGGYGGGAIRVTAGGTIQVDGSMTADGTSGGCPNNAAGGGSGGSIWLDAHTIEGSGTISASGGGGTSCWGTIGGGGGGGRIALYYTNGSFGGAVHAFGGRGDRPGGAGTVFWKEAMAPLGKIVLDNGAYVGGLTTLIGEVAFDADMYVRAGAILSPQPTTGWFHLILQGDLIIEESGFISANGRGFAPSEGPGQGVDGDGSGGGGYGGAGGRGSGGGGGGVYGSVEQPTDLGSGSGLEPLRRTGGYGGGAIRVTAGGTIQVDGSMTADGTSGGCPNNAAGGGSGGSIWLDAHTIEGSGTISASGGGGTSCWGTIGGGGGGGRIALYSCDNLLGAAQIRVNGGSGTQSGFPGTVHLEQQPSEQCTP